MQRKAVCLTSGPLLVLAGAGTGKTTVLVNRIAHIMSFGCACEDMLRKIGPEYGLEFVRFLKSPIEELVKYHGV